MAAHRDTPGTLAGMLVFLGGIAMVAFAFSIALTTFSASPETTLNLGTSETINLNRTLAAVLVLIAKILLLLVMSITGSVIASRGIRMYASSIRVHRDDREPAPKDRDE